MYDTTRRNVHLYPVIPCFKLEIADLRESVRSELLITSLPVFENRYAIGRTYGAGETYLVDFNQNIQQNEKAQEEIFNRNNMATSAALLGGRQIHFKRKNDITIAKELVQSALYILLTNTDDTMQNKTHSTGIGTFINNISTSEKNNPQGAKFLSFNPFLLVLGFHYAICGKYPLSKPHFNDWKRIVNRMNVPPSFVNFPDKQTVETFLAKNRMSDNDISLYIDVCKWPDGMFFDFF